MEPNQVAGDASVTLGRHVAAMEFRNAAFSSKEAARDALDKFLALFGKSKASNGDSMRWMSYKCKDPQCPFRVNFSFESANDSWHVSCLEGVDHNPCAGTLKPTSRVIAELLKGVEPSVLHGPIKALQFYVAKELNMTVNLRQVSRAKAKLLDLIDRWQESFAEIPAYVAEFMRLNPGGYAAYTVHPETRVFRGLAVFPPTAKTAAACFKPVWALDASHLRSDWPHGRLLLLVAQDWNKSNVILGAAIVDSESAENYAWFLAQARQIPEIAAALDDRRRRLAIISDRGQAITAALSTYTPAVVQRHCTKHLIGNLKAYLRRDNIALPLVMEHATWKLQEASSEREFNVLLQTYRARHPEAVGYLETAIEPEKWTSWASPVPMYGIRTSNMVEQENAAALLPREAQSPLDAIDELLIALLVRLHRNSNAANQAALRQPDDALCKNASKEVETQLAQSAQYQAFVVPAPTLRFVVRRVGRIDARDDRLVTISDDSTTYTCSCLIPFHLQLPCRHVYAAAKLVNVRNPVVRKEYTVAEHAQHYQAMGFDTPARQELAHSDDVMPPTRSKRKRKRGPAPRLPSQMEIPNAGENVRPGRVRRRCSQCRGVGHNRRSCPSQSTNDVHP